MNIERLSNFSPVNGTPTVVVVCRNEKLRLPYLFDYYRRKGFTQFIVIDNMSTDGTQDMLLSHDDVVLFSTEDSYKDANAGIDWVNHVLDLYCLNTWVLVVDADEMVVFPMADSVGFPKLIRFMEAEGAKALFTTMVDMYPAGSLRDAVYTSGTPFTDVANRFDGSGYYAFPAKKFPYLQIRGGVRKRVFFPEEQLNSSPVLNKVPLVYWEEGSSFAGSTHVMNSSTTLASLTGAVLHFKYFSDFADNVEREVARDDRPFMSEYIAYDELLKSDSFTTFVDDVTLEYEGPRSLVQCGLMRHNWDWHNFVQDTRKDDDFRALKPLKPHDVSISTSFIVSQIATRQKY